MTDELTEKVAILCAEGNNGGTWATHYTDEQKDIWRGRAARVIAAVREAEGGSRTHTPKDAI